MIPMRTSPFIRIGALALLIFVALTLPVTAQGSSSSDIFPLVFCGRSGQPACTVCDLLVLVDKIKNFIFFFLIPVVGAIFVVWAGFKLLLSQGKPEEIKKATGYLWNIAIGAGIVALSWLFTNTIIQTLAKKDNVSRTWTSVECRAPAATPSPTGLPTTPTGSPTTTPVTGTLSDQAARQQLAAAGIGVNAQPPQTSLEGIRQETINAIIAAKQRCGCSVTITAGTEGGGGHTPGEHSHGTGYKVDLRLNSALDSYVTTNFPYIGTRSDGARQYRDPSTGAVYALESDHWDVLVE